MPWTNLKAADKGNVLAAYAPPMVKVYMPWRFAGSMLRSLAEMGYDPTRYFPGYDGAGRAVLEREFWT